MRRKIGWLAQASLPLPCRTAPNANTHTMKLERGLLHFQSPISFSLCIAGLFVLFFNLRFWQEATAAVWQGSPMDALFLVTLSLLLWMGLSSLLLLVPGRIPMQVVAALLFPLGAMAAYCADSYGLPIDQTMIRSFFATHREEARGMLSLRLLLYAILLGVLPIVFVGRTRLSPLGWRKQIRQRMAFAALVAASGMAIVLAFLPRFQVLASEHRHLAYLMVPGAVVEGTVGFARSGMESLLRDASAAAASMPYRIASPPAAKPLLVLLVVGETARHANFQLGGYVRPTNPRLSALDGVHYFSNVKACATATVISLPCMFSPLGRGQFTLQQAAQFPSVLDVLMDVGIHVAWHSNNAGTQDVSARVRTIDASKDAPPDLCPSAPCFDEVLLHSLAREVDGISGDALIVLHQIGSHGPDYARRVPPRWKAFSPVCETNESQRCDPASLVNVYDNTIVYTDHLLAAKIDLLNRLAGRFDTALFYVSDHGESLGENGRYLHGMPYAVAPDEQTRVPMMIWMSSAYISRFGMDLGCVRRLTPERFSHDHLYHTLLGMMAARNERYQGSMDVLGACRGSGRP